MVRFLLLSDIHLLCLAREHDVHCYVRECFIQDLKDYVSEKGIIDHILVSGDIAFKGEETEYSEALNFFKAVCEAVGCSLTDVYVIPGNHDKNYNAARDDLRHIINMGLSSIETDCKVSLSELFYKMLLNDSDAMRMIYSPFRAYLNFALEMDSYEDLMQRVLDNDNYQYAPETDKVYYQKHIDSIGGYKVNLYGINSCLTSDWYDEDDDGTGHKLFLPKLSYNMPVETEGCVNISMMHHPLEKIAFGDEIGSCLDTKFHVQIYGHLHKPVSSIDTSVRIQSGAFQPPEYAADEKEGYFSVYNIVELDIKRSNPNDTLVVKLQVEKFNKDSKKFEHLIQESPTYEIPLKKHNNRWKDEPIDGIKTDHQPLPEGVSIRQVRLTFLQSDSRVSLIKKYSKYNDKISLNANCISFLNKMEENDKLSELWIDLK